MKPQRIIGLLPGQPETNGYVDLNLAASSGASLSGNTHASTTNTTPVWVWIALGIVGLLTVVFFIKGMQKAN